jgi:hypothetical protein
MLGGVVSSSSSLPGHLHDREELAFHYAAKRFENPGALEEGTILRGVPG